MIRVGIGIPFDSNGWLGGLNYFNNLLLPIRAIQDQRIHPVIFAGTNALDQLRKALPEAELIGTRLLDTKHPYRLMRRAWQKAFGSEAILERFLSRHGIQVWSHSGSLGRHSKIATIGWIPDFQHRHFPNLFSARELADRDSGLAEICLCCDSVLVSSRHAEGDALAFYPDCASRLRVLSFVSDPTAYLSRIDLPTLQRRYGFAGRYFFVPNQFWVHKNHRVILDALALAIAADPKIQVLSTGSTSDNRQPRYFAQLMQHAQQQGVSAAFKCLGIVPYEDLVCLMQNACAVINPSLFEGWSTSVEEARTLGKRILLSRIPVHVEQAPPRSIFFGLDSAPALAAAMLKINAEWDAAAERDETIRAVAQLQDRQRQFGETYQAIVLETLARKARP